MGIKSGFARVLTGIAAWLSRPSKPEEQPATQTVFETPTQTTQKEEVGQQKGLEEPAGGLIKEIHQLWDFLKVNEHTQAHHLISVIGFEEWVAMEEILRRIEELFGVKYKNERSLYPYLKTLVDVGFFEATNIGGRRKWRKKELLLTVLIEEFERKRLWKKRVGAAQKQ